MKGFLAHISPTWLAPNLAPVFSSIIFFKNRNEGHPMILMFVQKLQHRNTLTLPKLATLPTEPGTLAEIKCQYINIHFMREKKNMKFIDVVHSIAFSLVKFLLSATFGALLAMVNISDIPYPCKRIRKLDAIDCLDTNLSGGDFLVHNREKIELPRSVASGLAFCRRFPVRILERCPNLW